MRTFRLSAIASGLLLASLAAHGAAAGRVVVAVGDTVAVRNGRAIRLVTGAEVETGDTLKVGAQSNLQVRFTDDALVALRPNTEYRIDDYKFVNQPGEDRSFFSLIKGGVRAITGLIARVNRDRYGVKTPTATIGIRGTHFNLVHCGGDCRSNGGLADNGLYGGVTDGRIVVRNEAGEVEFGKAEYFHVATASSAPTPLLAPPSFLRDRLEGQAATRRKAGGKQEAAVKGETNGDTAGAAPAAAGEAGTGNGESAGGSSESTTSTEDGGTSSTTSTSSSDGSNDTNGTVGTTSTASGTTTATTETTSSTASAPTASGDGLASNTEVTTQPTLSTTVATTSTTPETTYTAAEQPLVQETLVTTTSSPAPVTWKSAGVEAATGVGTGGTATGGLGVFAFTHGTQETVTNDGSVFPLTGTIVDFNTLAWSVSDAPFTRTFVDQNTGSATFGQTVTESGTESFSKTASVDTGSAAGAGKAFWGRYAETATHSITSGPKAGTTFSEARDVHWLVGDPVAALPSVGTFAYDWVGGTTPTYVTTANGSNPSPAQLGTLGSGGALSVNFTNKVIATTSPITWATPNASYSLSFSSPFPGTSASLFSGSGIVSTAEDVAPINTPASCLAGCLVTSVGATVTPKFLGAGGEGLALGIASAAPVAVGVTEFTASVQAYQQGAAVTTPPTTGTATWNVATVEAATGVAAGGAGGQFAVADAFVDTLSNDGSVFPLALSPLDFNMTSQAVSNAPFTETFVDQNTGSPTFGQTVTMTGTESFSKTPSTDTGSAAAAGNLFWGRYAKAVSETISSGPGAGTSFSEEKDVHWMVGDPVVALPTAGTFAYNWVGGTIPTYVTTTNGSNPVPPQLGSLGSGGALSVNFTNQVIATTSPITWATPNASYSLSFSSPFPSTTPSTFSGSGITSTTSDVLPIQVPVTCLSGCLVTSVAGAVAPQFMGAGGEGLALSISSTAPLSVSVSEFTASVQGYQKGVQTAP